MTAAKLRLIIKLAAELLDEQEGKSSIRAVKETENDLLARRLVEKSIRRSKSKMKVA